MMDRCQERSARTKKGHASRTADAREKMSRTHTARYALWTPEQRREHGLRIAAGHKVNKFRQAAEALQAVADRVLAEARERRETEERAMRARAMNP